MEAKTVVVIEEIDKNMYTQVKKEHQEVSTTITQGTGEYCTQQQQQQTIHAAANVYEGQCIIETPKIEWVHKEQEEQEEKGPSKRQLLDMVNGLTIEYEKMRKTLIEEAIRNSRVTQQLQHQNAWMRQRLQAIRPIRQRKVRSVLDHRKYRGKIVFKTIWNGLEWRPIWEELEIVKDKDSAALREYLETITPKKRANLEEASEDIRDVLRD